MRVVDRSLNQTLETEEHAAMPLAGGIAQYGYQCGMLWGAALAAGAKAYKLFGTGPQAETAAIMAAQKVVESFRGQTKNEINCLEISDLNWRAKNKLPQILKFLVKGGPINCFRMVCKYAPAAFDSITTALSEGKIDAPSPPVSCASLLAQKMGVSEMHVTTAAGLAGGIGLSGGGCGALGAAIWIMEMRDSKEKVSYSAANKRASDIIKKFLKKSDFKFECAEIVGRRFESISDHADYIRGGGCAEIIEVLAGG